MDGLRACLTDEFTSLYVFNLRGNQRTSGETSRLEGGKIFGSGSRAPIAITLLVKNPTHKGKSKLHYHDIGDYLSRDEKLRIIKSFNSIAGIAKAKKWTSIKPNPEHDWINQRDPAFADFYAISSKESGVSTVFLDHSSGVKTNRDAWVYSFGEKAVAGQMRRMIDMYKSQVEDFIEVCVGVDKKTRKSMVDEFIETDPKKINWTRELKGDLVKHKSAIFKSTAIRPAHYRPFTKQYLYFDRQFNNCVYQLPKVFPKPEIENLLICATGTGATKEFSSLIVDVVPDLEMISKSVCFPLYLYDKAEDDGKLSFDEGEIIDGYRRRDAITDVMLKTFRDAYDKKVTKEDIFYYVYGILHSPEYRTRFAADLKKMLPRIPLTKETKDFWAFSKAGRDLAHWHLNYETVEPWAVVFFDEAPMSMPAEEKFKVKKMAFARPTQQQKDAGEKWDKTRIIYNSHLTISEIPLEAYDYVVNGKSAIEWVMERYAVTVDKDSGIRKDPNDWCTEHNNPRYIIDLIARLVRVSIETMKIVESLPVLNEKQLKS